MKLRYHLYNILHYLGFTERYCDERLYKVFDKFNKKYFDGELPPIPIYVDNSIYSWGRFSFNYKIYNKRKQPLYILINYQELANDPKEFINVMVHEMVHYYECLHIIPSDEQWKAAVEYRESHKIHDEHDYNKVVDAIHNILDPREKEFYHSTFFKEIGHKLNQKFPELKLRISFGYDVL